MGEKYKVNSVNRISKINESPHKEHSNEQRKDQKREEKTFGIQDAKEEQSKEKKPQTPIWELYEIAQYDNQQKRKDLTGSTLWNQCSDKTESLMCQLYELSKKQSTIDELDGLVRKKTKTPNSKNYEKYNSFEEK